MASRWRKTGARARPEHYEGLASGVVVEAVMYDDKCRPQGHALLILAAKEIDEAEEEGQVWGCHFLSIQDDYYTWWHQNEHGPLKEGRLHRIHLCGRPCKTCGVETPFRQVTHIDVYRMLEGDGHERLSWLTPEGKATMHEILEGHRLRKGDSKKDHKSEARPCGSDGVGLTPVLPGAEGLTGLAAALSGGGKAPDAESPASPRESISGGAGEAKRRRAKEKGEESSSTYREELDKREGVKSRDSALRLNKKRRKKRGKKEGKGSKSSSSSSSGEEVFRVASLPEGVDRLRQIHQEQPGHLANLTLLKYQELLEQSAGREAGTKHHEMFPPCARAYLHQWLVPRRSSSHFGIRTMKEMETIMTVVDLLASNDILRGLDVLIQRQKAIELAADQGSWAQAQYLELTHADEEHSYFRQELKAVQAERKADLKLQQMAWAPRGWKGEWKGGKGQPKGDGGGDAVVTDGTAPLNDVGDPAKGKGRGKKGRGKWKK